MKTGTSMRRGITSLCVATLSWLGASIAWAAPEPGEAQGNPASQASAAQIDQAPSDVIVHEWGTFLGMNGSDGTALDGMYHEEHALPGFVHARSRDQLRLPSVLTKGETPVIYFYTQNRQQVRVGVGFPEGIWTQWYPQAAAVLPPLAQQAERPERIAGGRICWFAELVPATANNAEIGKPRGAKPQRDPELPATRSDALWNFARDVDAAFVKVIDSSKDRACPEFEKFLFYRGLGRARLPLRLDARGGGTLALDRTPDLGEGIRHIFVLRVENGRGAFRHLPALRPGEQASGVIPSLDRSQSAVEFSHTLADALAAALLDSGLYAKEARAMVNTWSNSYFQTDGVRILFVLPQSWTDASIPITVVPRPKQVVRVMVGRLELLLPERERLAENAVLGLAAADPITRRRAFQFLHEQGRYVEPIIRRVLRTTRDQEVRTLCKRLLMTEFVTELRAAVTSAADGKRLACDRLLLRAQLGRLLRDVGLDSEARREGDAVLASLKTYPLPPDQTPNSSPEVLEIRAAAFGAIGDDPRAGATFGRRIELQAKAVQGQMDPNMIAWLRDWWVGRAYAQSVARTGKAATIIAALEGRLAPPPSTAVVCGSDDRVSRMLLAFLLDEQGKPAAADLHWSALLKKPALNAAAAALISQDEASKPSGS